MIIENIYNLFLSVQTEQAGELQEIVFDLSHVFENNGFEIALIGYLIVFAALWFLSIFIFYMTKILNRSQRKRLRETGHRMAESEDLSYSGEVNAAIATALSLHFGEIHDEESGMLTISVKPRRYTPWSSKLYNLRDEPIKLNRRSNEKI